MRNSVAGRRKALGLTQTELALASRLTRPLVSALETGRHVPSVKAALAIAQALGVSVEEIFGDTEETGQQLPALGTAPQADDVPVVAVRVGELLTYHPLGDGGVNGASWGRADGLYHGGRVELFDDTDAGGFAVAGCEPAVGLASSLLPGRGPQRVVAIAASSAAAMEALHAGRVHAAVVHGRPGHLRRSEPGVRRFALAAWNVGLASRAGVPAQLEQLARGKLTAARREPGAESQRALERALAPYGGSDKLAGTAASSHFEAARRVAYGSVDVGVTMEAAALAYGLDFAPLETHRVELRIAEAWDDHPGARALLDLIVSGAFRRRLNAFGGYDLSHIGPVA
jgi:DNA-binding XRE family transcriptional regulator